MTKTYQPHIFMQFSVNDVREALKECAGDYPLLENLTDDQIDKALNVGAKEKWEIWGLENELKLFSLERLVRHYGLHKAYK